MPLALWPIKQSAPASPTAQTDTSAAASAPMVPGGEEGRRLPAELARRVIAEYSRPGDLVLDVACTTPTVLLAAGKWQRRAAGVTGDDRLAASIADAAFDFWERDPADGAAANAVSDPAPAAPDAEPEVEVITADICRLPELRPDLVGAVGLAILVPSANPDLHKPALRAARATRTHARSEVSRQARSPEQTGEQVLSVSLEAVRRLLRPGGLLVTVTASDSSGAVFHDRAGEMIRAATSAGFGYTQHVIALLAGIDGDRLVPTTTPASGSGQGGPARAVRRRCGHVLVHQDVCVFTAPPTPGPSANPSNGVIA